MATAADTLMFQGTGIGIFSHQTQIANLSFDSSAKTITRAAGSFVSDGYLAGQFLTAEDSTQNKKRCFRIAAGGVAALVLTLEDAPVTAAAALVTLRAFTPLGLVTGYSGPGSSNPRVDVSHSLSTAREYKSGLQDNGSFTFEGNTARGDAGLIALKNLRASRANADFLIADADRLGFSRFNGGVESFERSGQLDGAITFSGSIYVSGAEIDSELFA